MRADATAYSSTISPTTPTVNAPAVAVSADPYAIVWPYAGGARGHETGRGLRHVLGVGERPSVRGSDHDVLHEIERNRDPREEAGDERLELAGRLRPRGVDATYAFASSPM